MTIELKVCSKCHLELSVTSFTIADKAKGRRLAVCKACTSARVRAYYASNAEYREKAKVNSTKQAKANPERTAVWVRRAKLKTDYGLTMEQFDQLLVAQGGKCALCGATEHGRKQRLHPGGHKWLEDSWPVDHCHKDGRVRGLLCHPCNANLGGYESLMDKVGEVRLLEYLNRPSPVLSLPVAPSEDAPHDPRVTARFVVDLPPRYTRGACIVCGADQHAGGLCFKHYMRARRRNGDAGPAENLPRGTLKGAAHHKSSLTEEQARTIKASAERGVDLAHRFNVAPAVISSIRNGHTWKHLSEEGQ